jgi:hypothetical protein
VVLAMRTSKRVIFFIICCWKVRSRAMEGGVLLLEGGVELCCF